MDQEDPMGGPLLRVAPPRPGEPETNPGWYPPFKTYIRKFPLKSPTDRYAHSEFVFRACSSKSGGINKATGIIAGKYRHLPIDKVPTLDDVGTPRGKWSMTYREFAFYTLSHCNKGNKHPTPWISTSPSLAKVLPYAFGDASQGVIDTTIFVIRILDCKDIYSAPSVTEGLPTISHLVRPVWNNEIATEGKVDEYFVFGKIPANAIAGVLPYHKLGRLKKSMDSYGSSLMSQMMSIATQPWKRNIHASISRDDPREVGQGYLRAAIRFVSAFDKLEDEYVFFWLVRILLGLDFGGPYREQRDGDRVRQEISSFLANGRRFTSALGDISGSGSSGATGGMGYGGFNGPMVLDAGRFTADPQSLNSNGFGLRLSGSRGFGSKGVGATLFGSHGSGSKGIPVKLVGSKGSGARSVYGSNSFRYRERGDPLQSPLIICP